MGLRGKPKQREEEGARKAPTRYHFQGQSIKPARCNILKPSTPKPCLSGTEFPWLYLDWLCCSCTSEETILLPPWNRVQLKSNCLEVEEDPRGRTTMTNSPSLYTPAALTNALDPSGCFRSTCKLLGPWKVFNMGPQAHHF